MPLTPFHIGPHATIGLLLGRKIDLPVLILANVIIDIEPLLVVYLKPNYPLHGYFHTFLFGGILGIFWGLLGIRLSNFLKAVMNRFLLNYQTNNLKVMYSSILGVWLHIVFDAPIYTDIKPFFPIMSNPFYGLISLPDMYKACLILFAPAILLFIIAVKNSPSAIPEIPS